MFNLFLTFEQKRVLCCSKIFLVKRVFCDFCQLALFNISLISVDTVNGFQCNSLFSSQSTSKHGDHFTYFSTKIRFSGSFHHFAIKFLTKKKIIRTLKESFKVFVKLGRKMRRFVTPVTSRNRLKQLSKQN